MAIYLDYAATAPIDERVLEAYTHALGTVGNPSSTHQHGRVARELVEDARERLAAVLNADAAEVVFTSGGTESINLGIKGLFATRQRDARRPRVLTSAAEHHAGLEATRALEAAGASVDFIAVNHDAAVTAEGVTEALNSSGAGNDEIALASLMLANNEVGTVTDLAAISPVLAAAGVPLHVDAVAAFGSVAVDFVRSGAATMSVSAHKIGAPVGIGALVIRRDVELAAQQHGGEQQRARSGTLDAAGAHAFAVAAELAAQELEATSQRLRELRRHLVDGVMHRIDGATLRGASLDDLLTDGSPARLPGNAHFTFAGCQGDSLLFLLDQAGISVSTGSACQAGVAEVSHVMLALGLDEHTAIGALRFSLGPNTTREEIDRLLEVLPPVVDSARSAGVSVAK